MYRPWSTSIYAAAPLISWLLCASKVSWSSRARSSELQSSAGCVGTSVSQHPGPDGAARRAGRKAVHPDSWSVATSAPRPRIVGPLRALASPENNSHASPVTATPATQPSILWVQGAISVEMCKPCVWCPPNQHQQTSAGDTAPHHTALAPGGHPPHLCLLPLPLSTTLALAPSPPTHHTSCTILQLTSCTISVSRFQRAMEFGRHAKLNIAFL